MAATRRRGGSGIRTNPSQAGRMRRATRTKTGNKIPVDKLRRLKRSRDPKTRQRATFALNVRTGAIGGKRRRGGKRSR